MSEPKVAREVAEKEVENWREQLECDLDDGVRERLVMVAMSGRVTFDSESEAFTLRLRKPLRLENGDDLTELKIEGFTFRQQQDATKGTEDPMEVSSRMLSMVTGQPAGILDRLQCKDVTTATAFMGFFA